MAERDYSQYIKNPSTKQDDRPFWLRLLLSIRPSFSFSAKKMPSDTEDALSKIKFKIKGGADF